VGCIGEFEDAGLDEVDGGLAVSAGGKDGELHGYEEVEVCAPDLLACNKIKHKAADRANKGGNQVRVDA
jgi:hypothetical protein